MNAFVGAYVAIFVVLVIFLLNVLGVLQVFELPEGGDPSGFVLALALFGVLMLAVIAAALRWPRAPRTPRGSDSSARFRECCSSCLTFRSS